MWPVLGKAQGWAGEVTASRLDLRDPWASGRPRGDTEPLGIGLKDLGTLRGSRWPWAQGCVRQGGDRPWWGTLAKRMGRGGLTGDWRTCWLQTDLRTEGTVGFACLSWLFVSGEELL